MSLTWDEIGGKVKRALASVLALKLPKYHLSIVNDFKAACRHTFLC